MTAYTELTEGGTGYGCEGYVVDSMAEQIPNWLAEEVCEHAELLTLYIGSHYASVAIGKSLHIEEEYRGKGIGTQLVANFIENADADIVLIVSDAYESQRDGFVLEDFYRRRGFGKVCDTSAGPFMVWPESAALKLSSAISDEKPEIVEKEMVLNES